MSVNVNKPTNKKLKEEDVNRKLQIYGIINAFQNGKVPSNDQIDVALNSFLASKALANPPDKLSAEGKVLVEDSREVVRQAKNLLLSKNNGNLLQDFIWQTTQFDPNAVSSPNAPKSKDAAKKDGEDALQGLRTLGTLLITNGQFRKLLKDSTVLLRDIAGDAATKAAGKVRPGEEDLAKIDAPAADNTWHEAPDLSKDNLKKQAKGVYGGNPKDDAKDVAANATNASVPDGTSDPTQLNRDQVDAVAGQDAARSTLQTKIDEKTDPETKEQIKQRNEEYRRRVADYFKQKVPQDRRDQTVFRLKKMILECQQHPDYMQAIQTLLRLAEEYGSHGRTYAQTSADSAKDARSGFAAAEDDLRTLIERFANGTSTSALWASIGQIYKDADQDAELKNWFKQMDSYIRRCLLEQGYIMEDASTEEWNRLHDKGQYLLREKYRSHTDRVIDEVKFLADQFDQDPQNQAFGQSMQKLFNDLGNDENGKSTFKPHLVKDLTEVIIPGILENIAYIPIPRIEYTDPQFDAIIENLVLESDNFTPNVLEIASDNYWRWGRKKIASKNKNSFEIKVKGIQMDLRDVSFHVKRKQGFPSITDTGVADLLLPGDGLSFNMKISTAEKKDRQNYFKVEKVDVNINDLQVKLTKSNHKVLFGLFRPIMLRVIRPPLQKAVEKAIKDKCNDLDKLFAEIKTEADRALEEAKMNPEDAPNIYQRYYNAAQKRIMQGKEKAKEFVEDKKVNVAMTKEDSIFPKIQLPGGISSKATEYKELARKGDKWESPVFSIGNAQKSSDIPTTPHIENKSRPVNGHSANALSGNNLNGSTALGNGKAPTNVLAVNGQPPLGTEPVVGQNPAVVGI